MLGFYVAWVTFSHLLDQWTPVLSMNNFHLHLNLQWFTDSLCKCLSLDPLCSWLIKLVFFHFQYAHLGFQVCCMCWILRIMPHDPYLCSAYHSTLLVSWCCTIIIFCLCPCKVLWSFLSNTLLLWLCCSTWKICVVLAHNCSPVVRLTPSCKIQQFSYSHAISLFLLHPIVSNLD